MNLSEHLGMVDLVSVTAPHYAAFLTGKKPFLYLPGGTPPRIDVGVSHLPGIAARVTAVAPGRFEIVIPKGILYRLMGCLRMLLAYWQRPHIHIEHNLVGSWEESLYQLPSILRPIFDEFSYLDSLIAALQAIPFADPLPDERLWDDIQGMLEFGLGFLFWHEAAHILRGHYELREALADERGLAAAGMTVQEALACMEIDADRTSGGAGVLWGIAEALHFGGSIARNGVRTGYVWTALLGMFDHQKKLLSHFDNGIYLPPSLRLKRILAGAAAEVGAYGQQVCDTWNGAAKLGWLESSSAFSWGAHAYKDPHSPNGMYMPLGSMLYPPEQSERSGLPPSGSWHAWMTLDRKWHDIYQERFLPWAFETLSTRLIKSLERKATAVTPTLEAAASTPQTGQPKHLSQPVKD